MRARCLIAQKPATLDDHLRSFCTVHARKLCDATAAGYHPIRANYELSYLTQTLRHKNSASPSVARVTTEPR